MRVQFLLGLVLVQFNLGGLHAPTIGGILQDAHQAVALGVAQSRAVKQQADFVFCAIIFVIGSDFLDQLVGFGKQSITMLHLSPHQCIYLRLQPVIQLDVRIHHRRTGDDQRRARLINEDRVHLVHDRKIMPALHLLLPAGGHAVVTQVIEAKLGVCSIGDVTLVLFTAQIRLHLALDAAHRQPEKLVDRAHPLGIARGEVIVHRHHMHAAPGEGIQINRQCGHQRLAFAGCHFRDTVGVQRVAANELYVKRDHLP